MLMVLPGLGAVPGQHQAKFHVQAIFENLPISFKVNLLMYRLSDHLALSTRNLPLSTHLQDDS